MKTILSIVVLLTVHTTAFAQARHITLQIAANPSGLATNELQIQSGEVADLVYLYGPNWAQVDFLKDGDVFPNIIGAGGSLNNQWKIAGPAIVRLRTFQFARNSFLTIKITPDQFSPDKAIIIPAGTAGANVVMECSTNLLTWTTVTNGFYSSTNVNLFFRIRADRVP